MSKRFGSSGGQQFRCTNSPRFSRCTAQCIRLLRPHSNHPPSMSKRFGSSRSSGSAASIPLCFARCSVQLVETVLRSSAKQEQAVHLGTEVPLRQSPALLALLRTDAYRTLHSLIWTVLRSSARHEQAVRFTREQLFRCTIHCASRDAPRRRTPRSAFAY